jgi:hypothetical protein
VSVHKRGFFSKIEEAIKITTGICPILRGLFFEPDKEIGKKDRLRTDTNKGDLGKSPMVMSAV